MTWWQNAECANDPNPDEWFQPGGVGTERMETLCRACPVNVDCLKWALEHERFGYWATTTEEQRDELRQRGGIKLFANVRGAGQAGLPCGTNAAGRRHHRRGEPPCGPCHAAIADANHKQWIKRKQRKRESA